MAHILAVVFAVFLPGCGSPVAPSPPSSSVANLPTATDPVLESAQTTAKTFLKLLKHSDDVSAFGLLSEGYKQRLPAEQRTRGYFLGLGTYERRATELSCGPGTLSDTKGQATFEGRATFEVPISPASQQQVLKEFTLVLVRDKKSGSWQVDLFSVHW